MALGDLSDRQAVESAIDEYDQLGRSDFLARYGFGPARRYFLLHRGLRYDSKAIVGAAHGYQYPEAGPLRHEDFSGGEDTVAKKLRALGFEVATGLREGLEQRYWAFCANPRRYRVRDAVRHCEVDYWTIGRSEPRAGDLAVIWQTLDSDGNRGIVAFAEIVGDPEVREDEHNPYWQNPDDGLVPQARVPVTYLLTDELPIWIDDPVAGALLRDLSVARAQGGTIFTVTLEQWQDLTQLVRLDIESDEEREAAGRSRVYVAAGPGQGFGLSPRERQVVEIHAMSRARQYLAVTWDQITDVSSRMSYDLHCKSGDETLRVEVKGTTTLGEKVVLTKNEVRESLDAGYALYVVSEIELDRSETEAPRATGGCGRYYVNFRAEDHTLTPISFTCELDDAKGVVDSRQ